MKNQYVKGGAQHPPSWRKVQSVARVPQRDKKRSDLRYADAMDINR
jgi:hypothetical protein